ncbi:lactadherin-like [Oculina patagonica]
MASGAICDKQISASTQYNNNHAPIQGRLHFQANGKVRGAWSAAINDAHQWLQIYLGSEPIIITGIAIQGRNGFCCQWVTGYNLQYSDDKVNFRYYREEGNTTKYFLGNVDQDGVVYHGLNRPMKARYVRFRPVHWNEWISMRVEVYGCSKACFSYWKPFASSLYAVFSMNNSWQKAEAFCNLMDARLVKIDSMEESSFVKAIVPDANFQFSHWIGLTDADMENHWKWSDGSSLGSYTNWRHGEPNNFYTEEDCVAIFNGLWYDYPCSYTIGFICEK